MRQQISFLTQSQYYSPAFNAAIFDGPIRIYFAQYQESLALKVYFLTQQRVKELFNEVREAFRKTGINIFVMLYPSSEAFQISAPNAGEGAQIIVDRLGHDFVIGVRGPIVDADVEKIYERIEEVMKAAQEVIPSETVLTTAAE